MGKPSRDKGLRWERKIVNRLKARGIHARRVPLSGSGFEKNDVSCGSWSIEAKNTSNARPLVWLRKATADAGTGAPAVVWNPGDEREAIVFMWLPDFEDLLERSTSLGSSPRTPLLEELEELVAKHRLSCSGSSVSTAPVIQ